MDGLIAYALAKKYTDEHGGGGSDSTHTGQGVPTASIVAKVGEYYTDLSTNEVYVCTNYINPTADITDLTGYTFYFNEKLSVDDIIVVIGEIPDPSANYNKNYSVNYTSPDKNTTLQTKLSFGWRPNASYYVMMSNTNGTMYETYNGGSWYNYGDQRRIKFDMTDAGTDKSNTDLINFIKKNAILDNTGSTWQKIITLPTTDTPQINSLLQYDTISNTWKATQSGNVTVTNPNSTTYYSQVRGGNDFVIYQNNNLAALYGADFRTVRFRMNNVNHYLAGMSLKTLLGTKDEAFGIITNGTNLNLSTLCQAGQSGYITSSVAANLTNCPTTEGFVLTSILLNQQYLTINNKNLIGVRTIITDSAAMFIQNFSSDNNGTFTFGSWKRITTTAEVPDAPTTDGNYVLKCSVSDGTPTYTWVQET